MNTGMRRMVPVMLGLGILAGCGGSAGDVEEIKKGQKDILAKLDGLEKSVQGIKAAGAAAAAPARPAVDPNTVYQLPVASSPVRGPKDAKVTIVEFADFQCPFCAQAQPLVDQVLQKYPKDVNYVYKQFPLPATMHPNALPAAKAALAAGKQGKYWEMHDLLFKNSRELGADKLEEYAKQLGLDVAKWKADMSAPDVQQQIDAEMKLGQTAAVSGTPSFFVGGKRVMNRSVDGFSEMIDTQLKDKKS